MRVIRHHTKDKGDIGLAFVIADLMSKGIYVALPIAEHLPFDCIAISPMGQMARVSVKYRAAKEGRITFTLKSSWADKRGTHDVKHDKTLYDVLAIYCPDTKQCYYVSARELSDQITLRFDQPKNGQSSGIRFALDYIDPARMFCE